MHLSVQRFTGKFSGISAMSIVAAFVIFFSSCKKENSTPVVPEKMPTVADKIVGKWNITSQYTYISVGGQPYSQPITTQSGSYFDFKGTGNVAISIDGQSKYDYTYEFKSDSTKILLSREGTQSAIYNINTLTSSTLEIASRTEDANGNFTESRIVMSK